MLKIIMLFQIFVANKMLIANKINSIKGNK